MNKTHAHGKLPLLMAVLCLLGLTSRAQTYCTPVYSTQGFSCTQGYGRIYNLNISGNNGSELNDVPACSPDYKDRTGAVAPLLFSAGSTYYGSIVLGHYTITYNIWIDFDDNGIFANSERVAALGYPNNGHITANTGTPAYFTSFPITLSVPASAPSGSHRMRVRTSYITGTPASTVMLDPCNSTNGTNIHLYGSTADYTVSIGASPCTPPTFTTLAGNQSICPGDNVSFSVVTNSPASLQWQVNNGSGYVNIVDGGIYSGATTNTLSVTGAPSSVNGYQYRCQATDAGCLATSNTAILWIKAAPITTHPANKTVPETGNTSMFISATTTPGSFNTYQWQVNTGSGFTNITNGGNYAGVTTTSLQINIVTLAMNGYQYRCVVSNGTCSNASNAATLTVLQAQLPQYYYTSPTTNNNVYPLSLSNMRSQFLYLPGDFGTVPAAGLIKRIYVRASFETTQPTILSDFKVDMGTTAITSLTGYATGLTSAVPAGTYTFPTVTAQEWVGIDLQTPIYYDPSKSLAVDMSQTVRTGAGITLMAGGVPVNPAYTGNTNAYGLTSVATGTARRYSYQFGFDMDPCTFTVSDKPANITVAAATTSCDAANVVLGTPTATSNCGTIAISNDAPIAFPKGSTTVTWIVTNGYVADTFTQTVTVVDSTPPVIVCPSNITVTAATGECSANVNYEMSISDNCGIINVARTGPASGDSFQLGTTTVTHTASDADNNTSNCSFSVTVLPSANNNVSISVTPANNIYTGGVPTTIYLGYGPQSATLNATAAGGTGYTYSWSPAAGLSCTNCQAPVFAPTAAGNYTYTVTATNSNGCSVTNTVTFCVQNIQVPNGNNKVYLCHNGNTLSISSNAVPAHLSNHTGDRLGNCNTSCGSANKLSYAEEHNDFGSPEIKVYPNPNNGRFVIELPAGMENAEVSIMDMTGKIIERKRSAGEQKISFDLDSIAKGVYMIHIISGTETERTRLIVQ